MGWGKTWCLDIFSGRPSQKLHSQKLICPTPVFQVRFVSFREGLFGINRTMIGNQSEASILGESEGNFYQSGNSIFLGVTVT